jgi:hypothetical protein
MPASLPTPVQRLSETVGDAAVRERFVQLVGDVMRLHQDVSVTLSGIDVRAEFSGRTLCRIVPYRELIHVQVGEDPVWETRMRSESGYAESVHRIVDEFLRAAAIAAGP